MPMLSVPSYLIPGTYLENVVWAFGEESLRDVEAIELLFFEWDEQAQRLLDDEVTQLTCYRDRFSYSVHMPATVTERDSTLIEATRDLANRFVVHTPSHAEDLDSFVGLMDDWTRRHGNVFDLENTVDSVDPGPIIDAVPGLRLCCDTGHLLLEGRSPAEFMHRWGDRVRSVHLHGAADGHDHRAFEATERWFVELRPLLGRDDLVVHLELFAAEAVRAVLASGAVSPP